MNVMAYLFEAMPNSKYICIIDNEEMALEAIELTLRLAGLEKVKSFTSWHAADKFISDKNTSLVLLDIIMPEISGIDVLKHIKSKTPDIPVIMATGVNDLDTAIQCMKAGAADYLVKPLKNDRLIECVHNALFITELVDYPPGETGARDDRSSVSSGSVTTATDEMASLTRWAKDLITIEPSFVQEEFRPLLSKFVEVVGKNKLYKDPDITLAALAERLETNTAYLSKFVNVVFRMNFRQFINRMRVAEFLNLAGSSESLIFSIEGLSQTVGFSRRATFYEAFKSITGQLPAQWLRDR